MEKTKLPEIKNRRSFTYINATPDNNYPIQILKAYLADAQAEWKVSKNKSIYDEMNKDQIKRRKVLKEAIRKLQV